MDPTIDIQLNVDKHEYIILVLPAAHALSGCDTTACLYGIDKATVVGILRTLSVPLSSIGDLSSPFEDVLKEATYFITACYKMRTNGSDMSSVRL